MSTIEFPKRDAQLQQARRDFIHELLDEMPDIWMETGLTIRLSVVTEMTTTFSIRIPSPKKKARDEHLQVSNCNLLDDLAREAEVRGVVSIIEASLLPPCRPATMCGDPVIDAHNQTAAHESNVIQFRGRCGETA